MLNLSPRLCIVCYRGDVLHALTLLDEEEDINKVLKYFSYEHFYVIYCKVKVNPLLLMFASHQVVICCKIPDEYVCHLWRILPGEDARMQPKPDGFIICNFSCNSLP